MAKRIRCSFPSKTIWTDVSHLPSSSTCKDVFVHAQKQALGGSASTQAFTVSLKKGIVLPSEPASLLRDGDHITFSESTEECISKDGAAFKKTRRGKRGGTRHHPKVAPSDASEAAAAAAPAAALHQLLAALPVESSSRPALTGGSKRKRDESPAVVGATQSTLSGSAGNRAAFQKQGVRDTSDATVVTGGSNALGEHSVRMRDDWEPVDAAHPPSIGDVLEWQELTLDEQTMAPALSQVFLGRVHNVTVTSTSAASPLLLHMLPMRWGPSKATATIDCGMKLPDPIDVDSLVNARRQRRAAHATTLPEPVLGGAEGGSVERVAVPRSLRTADAPVRSESCGVEEGYTPTSPAWRPQPAAADVVIESIAALPSAVPIHPESAAIHGAVSSPAAAPLGSTEASHAAAAHVAPPKDRRPTVRGTGSSARGTRQLAVGHIFTRLLSESTTTGSPAPPPPQK
jgi:hypothetical protein